jgi:hypothetical protein
METKFTKGEWVEHPRAKGNVIELETGRMVATCNNYFTNMDNGKCVEENHANAKLIIAAPVMLAALQNIVEQFEQIPERFPFPVDLADSIRVFGKEAIKKAID